MSRDSIPLPLLWKTKEDRNLVYKNAVSTITPTKPVKLLENIPVQPESTASEKLSAASEKETGAQQEPQAQPKQDTEQPQQ